MTRPLLWQDAFFFIQFPHQGPLTIFWKPVKTDSHFWRLEPKRLHSHLAYGIIFQLALKLLYQQVPLNGRIPVCQKPGSFRKICHSLETGTSWGRDLFINQVMGVQAFSKGRSLVNDSMGKAELLSAMESKIFSFAAFKNASVSAPVPCKLQSFSIFL